MEATITPLSVKTRFNLAQLAPGETGVVETVKLSPERHLYFLELGFTPGEEVRFIRTSPWGDPIEVEILGVRLGIRREEAQGIQVIRQEPLA